MAFALCKVSRQLRSRLSEAVNSGLLRDVAKRSVTYMPRPGDGAPRPVTLLPGDGIGPLVTNSVVQVLEAMHAPVYFETLDISGRMDRVPEEVIESIRRNKVCIKGGLATPVGGGVSSLNVQLRKELDLFVHLVHCFNIPGLETRHENVDIVVIRENTEGEYSGLEHEVVPGVVESLKVFLVKPGLGRSVECWSDLQLRYWTGSRCIPSSIRKDCRPEQVVSRFQFAEAVLVSPLGGALPHRAGSLGISEMLLGSKSREEVSSVVGEEDYRL